MNRLGTIRSPVPHLHRACLARLPSAGSRLPKRGFTLVELLMVIAIIGILAALLIVGAQRAVRRANQARISVEIASLDEAVQSYKARANGYPPDCSYVGGPTIRANRIHSHFRIAFPRAYVADYATLNTAMQTAMSSYPALPTHTWGDMNNLDQAEALVFWLGGLPAPPAASSKLAGFSAEARNPLQPGGSRLPGLFEFDQVRLADRDGDGWLEYFPAGNPVASQMPPYVYFDGTTYTSVTSAPYPAPYPATPASTYGVQPDMFQAEWGMAVPYAASPTAWVNPQKFQILSAGLDNKYGSAPAAAIKHFPIGFAYADSDLDNLTNFTGGTLEDAMP